MTLFSVAGTTSIGICQERSRTSLSHAFFFAMTRLFIYRRCKQKLLHGTLPDIAQLQIFQCNDTNGQWQMLQEWYLLEMACGQVSAVTSLVQ